MGEDVVREQTALNRDHLFPEAFIRVFASLRAAIESVTSFYVDFARTVRNVAVDDFPTPWSLDRDAVGVQR